jgi:hypothetical protein
LVIRCSRWLVKHENGKRRCMIFVFHRRIVNVKRSRPKRLSLSP